MQIKEDLEIVMMPVNEIIPYWRNPRRNDKTVDALEARLPKAGFNVPIVVDKNHVVIKGHARLRAAKRLGMEKVPVIISDVSEDIAKADRLADNKIQEMSGWDFAKLDPEIDRLPKMQLRSLFRPEENPVGEAEEMQAVEFKPVGLDFSASEDFSGEAGVNGQPEAGTPYAAATPVAAGYETPGEVPAAPAPASVPMPGGVPEKRQLKTLCPYCGKVVMISV